MSLFQLGNFRLHSGEVSDFKIACDTLDDGDWNTIAHLIAQRVPSFGDVYGIPRGGLPLEQRLWHLITRGPVLVVDDVLTTGKSMENAKEEYPDAIGAVVFARGPCPSWITPLFTLTEVRNQQEGDTR